MIRQFLILLPAAGVVGLSLSLLGRAVREAEALSGWRGALLAAAVLLGMVVALGSEVLGAIGLLSLAGVAVLWLAFDLVILVVSLRSGQLKRGLRRVREEAAQLGSWPVGDRMLLVGVAAVSSILLAIALAAPPNTSDSLLYHLPRVVHWLQDGSLRHYAASYHNQLWSPIWSELAITHLMALWGGDRLANLVQWGSMLAAGVAISAVAQEIGASRRGQLLSAVFGMTAPMAILQATSTQTDYVVGFWIVVTLFLLLRMLRTRLDRLGWILQGGSVGLGVLTKATFYPYVGLLMVGAFFLAWRRRGELLRLLLGGLIVAAVVVALNAGFWLRNLKTYGTPLGTVEMVSNNTSARFDPRSLVSNSIEHLALNFPTPSERLNERIITGVKSASGFLGQPNDEFRILWSWNHEDLAGNPVHISLIGLAIVLALATRAGDGRPRLYAGALLLSFLAYVWTVDSGVYRVRYQLPILLMGAPLVGSVADRKLPERAKLGVGLALLLLASPWLLFNQTRPAIGWRPRTRTDSIFVVSRDEALFANAPRAREPFSAAARVAAAGGCQRIGLSLDSHDLEYVFWWVLGAPESGVEVRVVRPLESLRPLIKPDYEPCAVICTNCQGEQFRGMPLLQTFGEVKTFTTR